MEKENIYLLTACCVLGNFEITAQALQPHMFWPVSPSPKYQFYVMGIYFVYQ